MFRRRRHGRAHGLTAILVAAAIGAVAAGTTSAAGPVATQTRVSFTAPDGDVNFFGEAPAVAYNPRADQHLVVWRGSTSALDEEEILGRLVDGQGVPLGAQFRISDMGPPGDAAFEPEEPAVAYNGRSNEYLVTWASDDDTGALVVNEYEVYVQRVSAAGVEVGTDDQRISTMGPDGSALFRAETPVVAANVQTGDYLVAWSSDDDRAPLVDGEQEIFVQRLSATGTEVGDDDARVSAMGPDGDALFGADEPTVVVNERSGEYLVAWDATDDAGALSPIELEVYTQRLSAAGAPVGADDLRISEMDVDGVGNGDASSPAAVYNPATDEYLVAWSGADNPVNASGLEVEIFAQRLSAAGAPVGIDDQRVSDLGPDGDGGFDAFEPSAAVGFRSGEYLITWRGDDDTPPLVEDQEEVFAQVLGATGAELGGDQRVSIMGPEGDPSFDADAPAVAYGSQRNEYLVAWDGDTNVAPLVADKVEVHARRFAAEPPSPTIAAVCGPTPPPPPRRSGNPGAITLTTGQLLINQRIDQAAIRRANGVQAWIDGGVEGRDLCQGTLAAGELAAGIVTGFTGIPLVLAPPSPRTIAIATPKPADPSAITLSVGQLFINQRISQAAIRRLNALKTRLDRGLTGGDIDDATLTRSQLQPGVQVLFAPAVTAPPAASTTSIAPAPPGDASKLTLSTGQLLINQRISQAAVRRANDLVARIEDGLTAGDIRDATVTGRDLAPGVAAASQ